MGENMLVSIGLMGFPAWVEILLAAGLDLVIPKPKILAQWRGPLDKWVDTIFRWSNGRGKLAVAHSQRPSQRMAWTVLAAVPLFLFVVLGLAVKVLDVAAPAFWVSLVRIALLFMVFDGGRYLRTGCQIAFALKHDRVDAARKLLAKLLDRDTEKLSVRGLARAGSEAVICGILQGGIAPMFCMGVVSRRWPFASLAGHSVSISYLYLGLLAISQYAQKNPSKAMDLRISELIFGWLMFFPSHVFAALIIASAWVFRKNARSGFWFLVQDNRKSKRPGDAWPMSALAGSLGIRLGGGAYYNGVWADAPSYGFDVYSPNTSHLWYTLAIGFFAALICLAIAVFLPSVMILIAIGMAVAVYWGMMKGLNANAKKQ